MATASLTEYVSGATITLEYNAGNRRLTQVSWVVPAGAVVNYVVSRFGQVIDSGIMEGPTTGSKNLPAGLQMVEITDPIDGRVYLALPDGVHVQFG